MRKFAILLPLVLFGACQSSSAEPAASDRAPTVADVDNMKSDWESRRYFVSMGRRIDGRTNALDRDFSSIWATLNRHLFNYSESDPYVNHPTDSTYLWSTASQVGGRVYEDVAPWLPLSSHYTPEGK